jgi:ubiquinol-cytochrome c reductase iron-sulfur subunit
MSDHSLQAEAEIDQDRRGFLIMATVGTGVVGAAFAAVPFIASWSPSERARAAGAPVEFDVSKLEPGQMATVTYRKKAEQPQYAKNADRAVRNEFLVVEGTCTHLGCLPKARFEKAMPGLGADWPGGFLCPCHGSRFDLAGRVFNGSPASTNLRIPAYSYANENTLVIGVDAASTGAA